MKLTKKGKVEFEQWYLSQDYCTASLTEYSEDMVLRMFYAMDNSFKYGVLVYFFDVNDMLIETYSNASGYGFMVTKSGFNGTLIYEIDDDIFFETLDEVWIKAIEKVDELYNKKISKIRQNNINLGNSTII